MKKILYSLILILCMTAASASAEAAIEAKVDSANNKITVTGTADAGADVPIMLLKPLNGATLSAGNLGDYAVHIVSATADGTGAFSKVLQMRPVGDPLYVKGWFTLLTENGNTESTDTGLKVYYPNATECDSALAEVNSATASNMDAKLIAEYAAGVKNADILGVSITCPEYTNYKSAFCQTLFGKKPSGGWADVAAFQDDFEDTVDVHTRYIDALDAINGANLETITGVISSYNDILNLTLTGKYATYQSAINKNIVGTYSSLDAFITTFNYEVTTYQPPQAIIDGQSGGGGGGGGAPVISAPVTDTPVVVPAKVFSDIDSVSWAEDSIIRLANAGVISGTGENKFTPNGLVTREQFVKMVLLALDIPVNSGNAEFTDVSESDWYYSYVIAATELGIITGKDDGSFGAGEYVTREDMVTIASRAVIAANATLPETTTVSYIDDTDIAGYAKEAAISFGNAGIITGMPDGSFMPKDFSTRAQAAVMLDRLMQKTVG